MYNIPNPNMISNDIEKNIFENPFYKYSDHQRKRNEFGHLNQIYSNLNSGNEIKPPIQQIVSLLAHSNSGLSPIYPPPTPQYQFKKVTSFCLSQSLDLIKSSKLVYNLGLTPKYHKNFYYLVVKKDSSIFQQHYSCQANNEFNQTPPQISSTPNSNFSTPQQQSTENLQNSISQNHNQSPQQPSTAEEENDDGLIVVYDYGVMVFWNLSSQFQHRILTLFDEYKIDPLDFKLIDEMSYIENFNHHLNTPINLSSSHHFVSPSTKSSNGANITNSGSFIFNDVISLETNDILLKLSTSNTLSQSLKISNFEETIDHMITTYQEIPNTLAKTGKFHANEPKTGQLIGNVFKLKSILNSNLITFHNLSIISPFELNNTETQYEKFQNKFHSYLDIKPRVKLVKKKLEHLEGIINTCRSEIETKSSNRLEWIVIILIFFELLCMVIQFIFSLKTGR